MCTGLDPFSFLVISIAGWMNQRKQQVIEYLVEENRVLREQIGNRRMRFNDHQRCRLAAKAKKLGRKILAQIATIVTPETFGLASEADCTKVRWERKPKSRPAKDSKRDFRFGRPYGRREPDVGYRRIQGAIANLGHILAHSTIANILKGHGIEAAPERTRKTTWKEFLSRHWDQIIATDFLTIEVWTCSGLTRFVVLFFMDLKTRRVEVGGIASSANGLCMSQTARNLTDVVNGFFAGKRYLIHDRDPLYTKDFLAILAGSGIESVKLPLWSKKSSTLKRFGIPIA